MSESYEFAAPARVTVGTVGPVGQRVFYLQARDESRLVTLKLEKRQVEALARHLGRLLEDLPRPGHLPAEGDLELEDFADADFVVGTLAVAYDADLDRLIVLAEELVPEGESGDQVRLVLTREQAGAIAIRGVRLAESGRPPCPLCGFPLDPRGHACPRTNGHRAPLL